MIQKRNLRNRVSSKNSNRRLYESIMQDVAKTIKKHLNENSEDSFNDWLLQRFGCYDLYDYFREKVNEIDDLNKFNWYEKWKEFYEEL